jgi:hypothetical protein
LIAAYLKTYFRVLTAILVLVGVINLAIDPLWYAQGNRLTGINPPWNERVAKTNQLLQQPPDHWNCLILGTSRTTLFDDTSFQPDRCFNYAFSGAKAEELVTYATYAQQKGIQPDTVYVEIEPDELNRKRHPKDFPPVSDPLPLYKAYFFSGNSLWLSIKTLLRAYEFARLYDRNFHVQLADYAPQYQPQLLKDHEKPRRCDLSRLRFYEALRDIFPEARFVGFVAPVSGWYVFNESYSAGLMRCQLAGIHRLSSIFDIVYDFAVPSSLTTRTDNTYDGNHYYPAVLDRLAEVLQQPSAHSDSSTAGLVVSDYTLAGYRQLYSTRLHSFLVQIGEEEYWRG